MNKKICFDKRIFLLIVFLTALLTVFFLYDFSSSRLLEKNISSDTRASSPKKNILPKTILPSLNSKHAGKNEFPYFAKIIMPTGAICGGTLISDSYVLTAAHCVYREWKSGGTLKVLIGVNDYTGDYLGQFASVVEHTTNDTNIIVNENYIPTSPDDNIEKYKDLFRNTYDIALIKLKNKAVGVPTVSYPFASSNTNNYPEKRYEGQKATVAGIGILHLTDTVESDNLMTLDLPMADYNFRPSDVILLKSGNSTDEVITSGDSGGPALFYYNNRLYLIGVIKSSQPAWQSSYVTSASYYSDWIKINSQVQPEAGTVDKTIGDISDFPPQIPVCTTLHSIEDCTKFDWMCDWYGNPNNFCRAKK
jgi:secreted trypsin-like serine protease